MESTSARDIDRRLADLVRSERHLVIQFVVELAGFARRELYRELGYTSLFYYCVRQLGLSKSSASPPRSSARSGNATKSAVPGRWENDEDLCGSTHPASNSSSTTISRWLSEASRRSETSGCSAKP